MSLLSAVRKAHSHDYGLVSTFYICLSFRAGGERSKCVCRNASALLYNIREPGDRGPVTPGADVVRTGSAIVYSDLTSMPEDPMLLASPESCTSGQITAKGGDPGGSLSGVCASPIPSVLTILLVMTSGSSETSRRKPQSP
ncbi:hypothetical protein HAX54_029495 [Datura stramonium]|uniref:Uncharacterized protein n=1 Tax=Datura stramonium TaxID=4076 RepID=A0ABS8V862_DATST|nr:hypothetical protein [Datura stramonium]